MSREIYSNHVAYSKEALDETASGDGRLLFTKCREKDCAMLIRQGRLRAVQVLSSENERIGAVYIAKVRKVVPNLNACFVEIAGGEVCFLPFREAARFFRCSTVSNRKNNALCQGDELLVEITREAQKNKQATVTAHVSLSNEAAVIGIGSNKISYSSKLTKEQKNHYKSILSKQGYVMEGKFKVPDKFVQDIKPYIMDAVSNSGMVVRTLASEISDEEFLKLVEKLFIQFIELLTTARHRICYSYVRKPQPSFVSVIDRLVYDYEYQEIITDDESLYKQISEYAAERLPDKNVRLYKDDMLSLGKLYSIDSKIESALNSRVWLKSGAYLVIDHTEAMTVIDVNSGKYEASRSEHDTIYNINAEASREIALQIRLRNLSGIIIVDFINMNNETQNDALMQLMRAEVSADKQKSVVVDMTALGLVEITRRKDDKPLYEQFL